jgi:mono/diheme cytochrome c family protein
MLRKILKWTGIVLASLVLILAATYLAISLNINHRANKVYHFQPDTSSLPTDKASIEKGKHLVAIKGCNDCHGSNLGGKIFINDKALGLLSAVNLTKGKGGLPQNYNTADWMMALQHGVRKSNGKPLLFMPSYETAKLTENDKLALIAYINTLPPVDNILPAHNLGPVTKVMTFMGKMPLFSVDMIDHNATKMMTLKDSTEGPALGKYLTVSCVGCHRENFKGGDPVAPGFPPVPNITATGNMGKWTQQQFITTLRTGKTPEGKTMLAKDMPWPMTAQHTDKELASIYQFLKTLRN